MALNIRFTAEDIVLTDAQERRIHRHLEALERRLLQHPEPEAILVLKSHEAQRRVQVDLRLRLGPLGGHLVSHQSAETVDAAVRRAIEDIERQLERKLAKQRNEPAFGVPSRRRGPGQSSPGE